MTTTYTVLLPGDEDAWEALGADEQAAVFASHEAFTGALAERGHTVTGGAELDPLAARPRSCGWSTARRSSRRGRTPRPPSSWAASTSWRPTTSTAW